MKKILVPILVAAALVLPVACGSEDPGKNPASTKPATPSAGVLTQADFAPKVRAAMQAKGTFRSSRVNTDAEGVTKFTTDVKLSGDSAEVSGSGDVSGSGQVSSVIRVGGQLYAKDKILSKDPSKPWVKFDPKDTTLDRADLILLLALQTKTHELIGGADYATGFSSAPVGESTLYTMTIRHEKVATAEELGWYISSETIQEEKRVVVKATVDKETLLTKLEFELDGAKVVSDFTNYGAPVTIAAPAPAEIA